MGSKEARSVVKYHVMLHGVLKRAVRDRVIGHNPCAETELPKVVPAKVRILGPGGLRPAAGRDPGAVRNAGVTAIETGPRWGELIALRPRHVDLVSA
jgi:integrase